MRPGYTKYVKRVGVGVRDQHVPGSHKFVRRTQNRGYRFHKVKLSDDPFQELFDHIEKGGNREDEMSNGPDISTAPEID